MAHERYDDPRITNIFGDANRVALWEEVELAVCQARVELGQMPSQAFQEIEKGLRSKSTDIEWWKKREEATHHDLNAWLDERRRWIQNSLQPWFHNEMTSYDTEEPAFAMILIAATDVLFEFLNKLENTLVEQAIKYRYTLMMGETHGQAAELQTFGMRLIHWLQELRIGKEKLLEAVKLLEFSKLSGAIGNHTGISPELEAEALAILGLKPFDGATQIIPREVYASVSNAIHLVTQSCRKIAEDMRLGARSSLTLWREPFTSEQMGSSAMPHKKNTRILEKITGMAILADGYAVMLRNTIVTWNERSIEQSSVERIAWRDLFHVSIHALECLQDVVANLAVYPDNMLIEIVRTNGCYATSLAQSRLKEILEPLGITAKEAYRIIQLAAFNLQSARQEEHLPQSLSEARGLLIQKASSPLEPTVRRSIMDLIAGGELRQSSELAITTDQIEKWNSALSMAFQNWDNVTSWQEAFNPEYILRNENHTYKQVLGLAA